MHLLKIEWLKLKKYRTFYILIGLFFFIYNLINIAVNNGLFTIKTSSKGGPKVDLVSTDYAFPMVWSNMGYYFGWCIIFICVLVIINIANDYRYKTQRQHIIDGQSRLNYLHSKVVFILGINVAITIVYILLGLIYGFVNGGGDVLLGAENILYVFILGLNYISFSALLALLIKRSGLAIILLLSFVLFEEIIIAVIKWLGKVNLANYFPLDSSDGLLPKPLVGLAKGVAKNNTDVSNFTIMVIMSFVWIIVYYGIARWRMQKADL